jgi:hypothetical protein
MAVPDMAFSGPRLAAFTIIDKTYTLDVGVNLINPELLETMVKI